MKSEVMALCHHSMNEVERMHRYGSISDRLFRAFRCVWEWSAPRMGGMIGLRHDAFWDKYGRERYYNKINKVRQAFGFELIDWKAHERTE